MTETAGLAEAFDAVADDLEPVATGSETTGGRRGTATGAPAGEAVLQVVERDGVLHVEEGEAGRAVRRRWRGRSAADEDLKYERSFARLDRSQLGTWLERLDGKLTPERGLRRLDDAGLGPLAAVPADGRILLLIHGTFSESETLVGNLGATAGGAAFLDWARGHYSEILAFDHPTLSVSPVLNARALALLLGDTAAEIDVICHSRGGLVTRWWLEVFDRAPPEKRRAVFVGSPLAGTGLAAPTNLRGSLSLLANIGSALGTASAAVPFLTVLTGVFRVVTSVTSLAAKTPAVDAAVALVPGLAAQSRIGDNRELLSLRASAVPAAGRYFAVQSNFESEQHGWRFWRAFRRLGDHVKDTAADLVFDGANDLVVDTGSMTDLADALSIPREQVLDFGTTAEVHHTSYFAQAETLAFLRAMLEYGPPSTSAVAPKPSVSLPSATEPVPDEADLSDFSDLLQETFGGSADRAADADRGPVAGGGRPRWPDGYAGSPSEDAFVAPSTGGNAPKRPPRRGGEAKKSAAEEDTQRRGRGESNAEQVNKQGEPPESYPAQQQVQQQQMSAPPGPTVLRRTPHLDVDAPGALAPGDRVRVRVYADRRAARADEQTEDIVIELPPHLERVDLNTHLLVSPQLEVTGPVVQPLTIETGRDSSSVAAFEVRVRSRDEILALVRELPSVGRASISAVFNYQGRPSGSVTRLIELALDIQVPDLPNARERVAAGTLRIEADAQRPDLLVQVRAQPINDGRQFQCWVSTPLIAADEEAHWQDWNLPAVAKTIVRGYMESFVADDASALDRLSSLKGAGRRLFDAAPANFQSLYWKLVDAGQPPRSIAVVSDEPYIPWELMIPHRRRGGRSETRTPLGVECAIGRWVLGDGCSGPQRLPLSDSIVIAPHYTGRNALPHAEEEARFVLEHFPGIRIEPARLERIDSVFAGGGASLLHLSCHGVDDADSPAQAVYLDGDRRLDTTMLNGLDSVRAALEDRLTLVVINACEVGRPTPALVGLGGFAQTFIDLGAAGVVAALWSVRDDLAHEVAMTFYRSVLAQPERPFAEVLREVRARAYDRAAGAEDTYAAYCFYGDPLACAAP